MRARGHSCRTSSPTSRGEFLLQFVLFPGRGHGIGRFEGDDQRCGSEPHASLYSDPRSNTTTCLGSCSIFSCPWKFSPASLRTSLFVAAPGKHSSNAFFSVVRDSTPNTFLHMCSSVSGFARIFSKHVQERMRNDKAVHFRIDDPRAARFGSSSSGSFANDS